MSANRKAIVEQAITHTLEDYLRNPANYRLEQHISEDITDRLNSILSEVTVDEVSVNESSGARGTTDHIEYTKKYENTKTMRAALTEVSSKDFPFKTENDEPPRIDIGVFDDGRTLKIDDGTQLCDPEDLVAVIGVKYPKNKHFINLEGNKYNKIVEQIERLGDIKPGKQLERHYVVATNYGAFRDGRMDAKEGMKRAGEQNDVTLHFAVPRA